MFDADLAFHARNTPEAVAFLMPEGQATYAAMDADVDRFAAALSHLATAADAVVGVRVQNPYTHWLTMLALARLGIASVLPSDGYPVTWLVSDEPGHGTDVHVSADWLRRTMEAPRPPVKPVRPPQDRTGRIMLSSGTTGTPKAVALSWRALWEQSRETLALLGGGSARLMPLVGLDTILGLLTGLATWCGGRTLVYGHGLAALSVELPQLRPTLISLATAQLTALLARLPADTAADPDRHIVVGGSVVSPDLARASLTRLGGSLTVVYGATEAAGIAMGSHAALAGVEGAVGYAWPGQEVEIVNDDDRPVPRGAEGNIRVRGRYVATRYADDAEATARIFRDGWFYPGDLGRMSANGLLTVTGRADEVINLGGVKLLPQALEKMALACVGVLDAAAFALTGPAGGQRACIAIVRDEHVDLEALVAALRGGFPTIPAPRLVWVDGIPRNAMAKVERKRLATEVARYIDDAEP